MMKKNHRYYSFYKWYFRITSLLIVLALISFATKEKDDCDEIGEKTSKFYNTIVETDIENMNFMKLNANRSAEDFDVYMESIKVGLKNFNIYLDMSRNYFLCLQKK